MAFVITQPYAQVAAPGPGGSFLAFLQGGVYYQPAPPYAVVSLPTGYIDPSAANIVGASPVIPSTNTSGTPGNATINTPSGTAAIAAAAQTCTITNSLVTATSRILVTCDGNDATLTSVQVRSKAAGSFVVAGNAAATAAVAFDFLVFN